MYKPKSSTAHRATLRTVLAGVAAMTVATIVGSDTGVLADNSSVECPQTSSPTNWSGSFLDTNTTKNGVVFNANAAGGPALQLQRIGGTFVATPFKVTDDSLYVGAGDFNQDGFIDFAGAAQAHDGLRVFTNHTGDPVTVNGVVEDNAYWAAQFASNPLSVRPPNFVRGPSLSKSCIDSGSTARERTLAVGDFDGDGWPDILQLRTAQTDSTTLSVPITAQMFINKASNVTSVSTVSNCSGSQSTKTNTVVGDPQFNDPYSAMTTPSDTGSLPKEGSNVIVLDYNNDGKLDILIGNASSGGSIRILLNQCTLQNPQPANQPANGPKRCSNKPTFAFSSSLITNLDGSSNSGAYTTNSLPMFDYKDIDGDGLRDLIVGAPGCCTTDNKRIRIFKGVAGGGVEAVASQSVVNGGGGVVLLLNDFSLDGKLDFMEGIDQNVNTGFGFKGGDIYYWQNNGTATPFSGVVPTPVPAPTKTYTQQVAANPTPETDYDMGFAIDYDNDPDHTPDMMLANGNGGSYDFFADRVANTFVACGTATSGVIDLGSLANSEIIVTSIRIHPTMNLNGGTVQFFVSNQTPANFIPANDCGDHTGDLCATFNKPVGTTVQWEANMCSNAANTSTPSITAMTAKFNYTQAQQHFEAGVIEHEGIAYVGDFREPGDRGDFYAVNANLNSTYWNAASKIDAVADSTRNLYTADASGFVRTDFSTGNVNSPFLQSALGTANAADTTNVVSWVRSARFGVGDNAVPLTKLGSVETSTPGILTAPGLPDWYTFGDAIARGRVDTYVANNTDRVPLAMFGSKDGFIHAIITIATNTQAGGGDARNGTEAWGFVPPRIANGMLADYTASLNGTLTITSYPDGSPTLVDYVTAAGKMATAAVVASGNGGKSVTALDVTKTVDPGTGSVIGPTPLWSATPGDSNAGLTFTKPAVVRALINNAERWIVIAASGPDPAELPTDTSDLTGAIPSYQKGKSVVGYDLLTGVPLWQFTTACPITSDITAFETDDLAEPGGPSLNGYIDRAVFADKCGYLYKIDPNQDLSQPDGTAGFMTNPLFGSIVANTDANGVKSYALFSTQFTSGALGTHPAIAGTIAARTDDTTRVVLFFGTGGLQSQSEIVPNAFYAIYADTGVIRSKLLGACNASKTICDKFYGADVVSQTQVILTSTRDPAVATGTCDPGSSNIKALELNANSTASTDNFTTDFNVAIASAVMGSLFGDAGAIYFATLSGQVARIGTPNAGNAGDDAAAGQGSSTGTTASGGNGSLGTTVPLTTMGWRQVF